MKFDWHNAVARGYRGWLDRDWGPRAFMMADGFARSSRIVELRSTSGLTMTVLADRGLDIYDLTFRGVPLAWLSGVGPSSAWHYDREAQGWMDSWPGGFLTTCGLMNAGEPSTASGRPFGLHGSVSHIPAENVSWSGNSRDSEVRGDLLDRRAFGEALRLRRRISLSLHEPVFRIEDLVLNEGNSPVDLLMAYHLNLGWPLVGPGSILDRAISQTEPLNKYSAQSQVSLDSFPEPNPQSSEMTYLHTLDGKRPWGFCLSTAGRDLALAGRWTGTEMPYLAENRLFRPRDYVLSLEPTNCHLQGASWEREHGTPRVLAPGQSVSITLEFRVLTERSSIETVLQTFAGQDMADLVRKERRLARMGQLADSVGASRDMLI